MQDDGDLAGDRDPPLLGTDPPHEPHAPRFLGRPALGSMEQHAGLTMGTRDALMREGGLYSRLAELQFGPGGLMG